MSAISPLRCSATELVSGGLPDAMYNIISDDSQTLAFNAEGYYDAFYQRKPGSRSGLGCHVDSRLRIDSYVATHSRKTLPANVNR